ncbi:snare associated Golgi protein-domain-containing protein [Trametes polyzona]|nr:snare associated Golgi protein-domain-containing protein [Trametes polyzona]
MHRPYDQYPPPAAHNQYPPPTTNAANQNKDNVRVDERYLTRTPSPTPSEAEVLGPKTKKKRKGLIAPLFNPETWKNPKELVKTLVTLAILVLVILFIVYQHKIVEWMQPFANWMRRTPGGWAIPIAILIVLSFPPLFGHEIVAILVGDVFGIGIGFGIVAAGTLLGELANYLVFRWFCMARGRKWEETKLQYALLSEVVRQGGFLIALVIRYSAVPGHFTTAVFASCGMGLWTFLAAAVLSLPKQFVTVYLGAAQTEGKEDKTTKTVKIVVILITIAVTIFAMQYVKAQTEKIKEEVVYRRRKTRQAKIRAAAGLPPDPEYGPDSRSAHAALLAHDEMVDIDGVRLQVPAPQRGYGYAPLSVPAPTSEYAPPPPQPGYDQRARGASRSPRPAGDAYGSMSPRAEEAPAYGYGGYR